MQCVNHPEVAAQFQCSRCGQLTCDACVKRVGARRTDVAACKACDGLLKPVAAQNVLTGAAELGDLLRRPFSTEGIIAAIACAIPAVIPFLPARNWISSAAMAAYYFVIVSHIGRGRDGFPAPQDDFDELRTAFLRGILCTLVGGLPILLWVWLGNGSLLELAARPSVLFTLLVCGLAYVPAVILATVITDQTLAVVYPVAWIQIISRAPAQYGKLLVLFAATLVGWFIVLIVLGILVAQVPILGALVLGSAANLIWFTQAALVGGFLRRNAEVLGY